MGRHRPHGRAGAAFFRTHAVGPQLYALGLVSLKSGDGHIFYSGDSGYFSGFQEIGQRLPGIDIALMENGAYDSYWPGVHMSPEETVQAFQDLGARTLYLVHNSTFDLAFHGWREPLERVAAISKERSVNLWPRPKSARC